MTHLITRITRHLNLLKSESGCAFPIPFQAGRQDRTKNDRFPGHDPGISGRVPYSISQEAPGGGGT
jgi:hypothetical protein